MTFRLSDFARRRSIPPILVIFILIACASPADPGPATPSEIVSTLTPFQPQPTLLSPYVEGELSPLEEPTFTPFPIQLNAVENYVTPIAVTPQAANSGLSINNPLTGLPVNIPSLLERRPIAIKVGNSPDYVRPQSGLSLADVVYEYYIEW